MESHRLAVMRSDISFIYVSPMFAKSKILQQYEVLCISDMAYSNNPKFISLLTPVDDYPVISYPKTKIRISGYRFQKMVWPIPHLF